MSLEDGASLRLGLWRDLGMKNSSARHCAALRGKRSILCQLEGYTLESEMFKLPAYHISPESSVMGGSSTSYLWDFQ